MVIMSLNKVKINIEMGSLVNAISVKTEQMLLRLKKQKHGWQNLLWVENETLESLNKYTLVLNEVVITKVQGQDPITLLN